MIDSYETFLHKKNYMYFLISLRLNFLDKRACLCIKKIFNFKNRLFLFYFKNWLFLFYH